VNHGPILVVDDNRDLARGVALVLAELSPRIAVAHSAADALALLATNPFDLVISDIRMPGGDGMSLMHHIREGWPETRVILLTGFGTIPMAIDAIKAGAFHYLTKPFDNDELLAHARRALTEATEERELLELRAEDGHQQSFNGIVTQNRRMYELFDTIRRVAPSSAAVLICGESGTGKELVARAIHAHSDRKNRPFVAFNAAAMPESLAEAELFGAKKGAYTGAQADRRGLFQMADGGTLFIDEVASMPLTLQSKLLRVLQEHEVHPLGAERPQAVDVRIISAVNEDPAAMVKGGRLRGDLYYRLAVVTLSLPALRDRPDDIGLLATRFLRRANSDCLERELTPSALRRLMAHDWPGNVRELANVMERTALLCPGRDIQAEDIHIEGGSPASAPPAPLWPDDEPGEPGSEELEHVDLSMPYDTAKKQAVDRFQRAYVESLLKAHAGNISAAAVAAGITRAAIHRILKRWSEGDGAEPDDES